MVPTRTSVVPPPRAAAPPPPTSRLRIGVADGVVVVAITGEFDRTTAEHLRAELIDIGAVCVGVLAVDLSACTRLGETGIEVLGSAIVRSASGRFKVQVWADHPDVTTALHAAGINHQAGPVRPISSPG